MLAAGVAQDQACFVRRFLDRVGVVQGWWVMDWAGEGRKGGDGGDLGGMEGRKAGGRREGPELNSASMLSFLGVLTDDDTSAETQVTTFKVSQLSAVEEAAEEMARVKGSKSVELTPPPYLAV